MYLLVFPDDARKKTPVRFSLLEGGYERLAARRHYIRRIESVTKANQSGLQTVARDGLDEIPYP